jgi:hypothetical protein
MGFSDLFDKIRKISNTLGLGIPDKIDELFMPKIPSKEGLKIQREGSAKPIPVVYGTQFVGGIVVHKYVTNSVPFSSNESPNRFLNVIVVFCEGEIDEVEEVFFNGVKSTDKRFRHKNGNAWFTSEIMNGTEFQNSPLAEGAIPNWTGNHRLQGLCWGYFCFEQDKDQTIWSGEPKITARIRGKKVFDPRTLSVQYSDNPALCLWDYLTNKTYGKGLSFVRMDATKFIAAADNCDTIIDQVESTVTRSFYDSETGEYVTLPPQTTFTDITKHTCNLTIDTNETIFENTKIILNTFRGLLPPAYVLGPIVEEAGFPTFIFDDSNIESDVVIKSPNLNQRFNRVTVRFPNETSPTFDEDEAFYPASDSAIYQQFLDEDNGKQLEKVFDFNGINNMAEAQQMAEFLCKKSRFQISTTIEALPVSGQVAIGDIVGLTNEDNGYVEKPFRVKARTILGNGNYRFELVEHENNIYPWEDKAYTEIDGGTWLGDPSDVDAPTGLVFEADKSLSSAGTIKWDADDNLFVRHYIVEMLKIKDESGTDLPDPIEILKSVTPAPYFSVPIQEKGTYRFNVSKETTVGSVSLPASLDVALQNPAAPDFITVDADNFEAEVRAGYNVDAGVGTGFQFSLNDTLNPSGITGSVTFVRLSPNTVYTVFARAINSYGVSNWISQQFTTDNDGTKIIDVIGDDISDTILPDVITAVENDLQQIVQDSLVDYPTRTEVSTEISDAIDLVNSAFNEDPFDNILDTVNNILDNFDTEGNVKTESLERKTQVDVLLTDINGNTARLTTVETAVSDLDSATAARFTTVETQVGENASSIVTVELAVSDLNSSVAQQFTQIQAEVDGNAATITSVSTALANETSTRASQVTQLQAADTAIISRLDTVESDTDGNSTAISALEGNVNNPVTGLSATYNIASIAKVDSQNNGLAINTLEGQVNDPVNNNSALFGFTQQAQTTADGNAASITALQNQVDDPVNGLSATFFLASQAKLTADGNASSIAGLNTSVSDAQNDATSALTLATTLDSSLDEYRASAQLKVDANGNIGFIQLDATPTNSTITFLAADVEFKDPNGVKVIDYDLVNEKYTFRGIVEADGTFTGTVNSDSGTINSLTSTTINSTTRINARNINITGNGIIDIDTSSAFGVISNAASSGVNQGAVQGNSIGNGVGVLGRSESGAYAFYAQKGGYGPFTGSHDGLVTKDFKAEVGDIVCDGKLVHIADISNAILESELSTQKEQRNVTGVFVGKYNLDPKNLPTALVGYDGDLSKYDIIAFNALGEGVLNVCGEGGTIKAGDYICSSSMTGKGMKQQDQDFKRPYTIAKARHDVNFTSSDEIKQIAVKYLEG